MPFQFRKEAIEEDLNTNFPSQGQGNPPLYYSLSEVVVPTYSINSVAEGSGLPENLQTAWDFSTGSASRTQTDGTTTEINNTGFWKVSINAGVVTNTANSRARLQISDGLGTKTVFDFKQVLGTGLDAEAVETIVVFLRSGDSLISVMGTNNCSLNISYRQIADVNGNLVNPLGFSFA